MGRNKLTPEEIQARVADRGIILIAYGGGALKPSTWRCSKGHEWQAASGAVTSKTKPTNCPTCNNETRKTSCSISTESGKTTSALSAEEIQARVADRGFILVSYAGNSRDKSTWRCSQGHEWCAPSSQVTSGRHSGCLRCNNMSKNTAEELQARVADRGFTLVSYAGTMSGKSTWRCSQGHEWHTTADSVMHGTGCRQCNKITSEAIRASAMERGITLVSYGGTMTEKSTWRCSKGHEWHALARNVISRQSGCPRCSQHGFNPAKPGHVYVKLLYRADVGHVTGYGITNDIKTREHMHARNLSRAGFTVLRSAVFDFAHGADAARAEGVFDRLKGKRGIDCDGFKTESIHGDKFDLMCKALARIVLADER